MGGSFCKEQQPVIAILENVKGLVQVKDELIQMLGECGDYVIVTTTINPLNYGLPTDRDRYYIVMLHRDAVPNGRSDEQTVTLVNNIVQSLRTHSRVEVKDLMFPASHHLVRERAPETPAQMRCDSRCACRGDDKRGASDDLAVRPRQSVACKWRGTHWDYMEEVGLNPTKVAKLAKSIICFSTARQRHVVAIKLAEASKAGEVPGVIDPSQSPAYNSQATTDAVPVITPSCLHYVASAGRASIAEEKLIMQGFPVGVIDVGANSEGELAVMAGNAMNVRAVFVAMVAAFAAVDRGKFDKLMDKAVRFAKCKTAANTNNNNSSKQQQLQSSSSVGGVRVVGRGWGCGWVGWGWGWGWGWLGVWVGVGWGWGESGWGWGWGSLGGVGWSKRSIANWWPNSSQDHSHNPY
jgi:hypothetical protein